jgi:Fe-S-cluster containining protein
VASDARPADAAGRVALCRTDDPADLARVFADRLGGLDGPRRALAAWAMARDTLEGTLAAQKVEEGACRAGCAWCCRLEVETYFAEAAHLARRASADPALEARVRATAARVARLDGPAARMRAAVPCAFLDPATSACAAYEDRPLACRSYRSRDADWCRALVGTDGRGARASPVVREAIGIRGLVQKALLEVTPAGWRGRGELHALVVRVLDAVGRGGSGDGSGRGTTAPTAGPGRPLGPGPSSVG